MKKHNKYLLVASKRLRREMTKEERRLWYDFLRTYPIRFLRQKIIGNYIVDFYCAKAKLVVEVDGSQHYEDDAIQKDAFRTALLNSYNIKVIRVQNIDINDNFQGVCAYIDGIVNGILSQQLSRLSTSPHLANDKGDLNPSTSPPLAKGGLRGDLPLRDNVGLSESSASKTPTAYQWGQTLPVYCVALSKPPPLAKGRLSGKII